MRIGAFLPTKMFNFFEQSLSDALLSILLPYEHIAPRNKTVKLVQKITLIIQGILPLIHWFSIEM